MLLLLVLLITVVFVGVCEYRDELLRPVVDESEEGFLEVDEVELADLYVDYCEYVVSGVGVLNGVRETREG